jgi:hypothetical protein
VGDWVADHTLRVATAGLAARSSGVGAAAGRAAAIVDAKVRLQAYTLTYIESFHLIVWVCVGTLVLIALLRRAPFGYGDLAVVRRGGD